MRQEARAHGGESLYSNGTLQDLNNLIPANSGYQIMDANGINNNGQIVAEVFGGRTVLLTPTS